MDARALLLLIGVIVVTLLTAGGTAVRAVSRIWLRHWAERRLRGSDAALDFLDRPHRLLAASSAVVALVVVLLGVTLATWEGTRWWKFAFSVVATIASLLLVGQIAARAVARRWAAVVAPATLPVLRVAQLLAWPVLTVSRLAARPLEARGRRAGAAERDALQDLLREGELEGVGERGEIAIITGVVQFGERRVSDVMTPRERIFALDASTPPRALAEAIAQAGYTRVPIYDGTLDRVVGMVHAFDVLGASGERMPPIREMAFATPEMPCDDLLVRMLRDRRHLAIVRDAGVTVGLVTLEDVLEELVGEIRDEHDEPGPVGSSGR